jgi:uncharacterized protein YcbK (DUF882 family)
MAAPSAAEAKRPRIGRGQGDSLNHRLQPFARRAARAAIPLIAALSLWSCTTAGNDVQADLPSYDAASNLTDATAESTTETANAATVPLPTVKPGEQQPAALPIPAPASGDKPALVDEPEPGQPAAVATAEPTADAPTSEQTIVADAATPTVDPAAAGDGSVATAAPTEAVAPPKKTGLFAFFGSAKPRNPIVSNRDGGGAPAATAPIKQAAVSTAPQQVATAASTNAAPLPQLKMAALDIPGADDAGDEQQTARRSGPVSDDGGLPGVRQSALFEIKRRSGMDDDSDVDIYEEAPPVQMASVGGMGRGAHGLLTQHSSVDVACLKPALVRMLKQIESRYGRKLVVTSGYRSPSHNRRARGAKNSQHMYCAAADIQVPGVGKAELARFIRAMPGRGGVGTYCHTNSIHVDVGPNRDWNWRCRGRRRG